jgi:hypothetical protein
MPPPTLSVPLKEFTQTNATYVQISGAMSQLDPSLQKLVAEILLVRLFDDLQGSLSGIAYRLACGAAYLNGTPSTLIAPQARSASAARALFETYNRPKSQYCRWSRTEFIKESTKHVLSPGATFIVACDQHALIIAEMQAVRNRIVHKNARTKQTFDSILRRHYGGTPRGVSPGALLLSNRIAPSLLHTYLVGSRVLLRACCGL